MQCRAKSAVASVVTSAAVERVTAFVVGNLSARLNAAAAIAVLDPLWPSLAFRPSALSALPETPPPRQSAPESIADQICAPSQYGSDQGDPRRRRRRYHHHDHHRSLPLHVPRMNGGSTRWVYASYYGTGGATILDGVGKGGRRWGEMQILRGAVGAWRRRCDSRPVIAILDDARRMFAATRTLTTATTLTTTTRATPDPMARRPNKKCDPYGQGGKPLSQDEAKNLLCTLNDGWELSYENVFMTSARNEKENEKDGKETVAMKTNTDEAPPPLSLRKEFYHRDFLSGSRFVSVMAAVGHNNNHYPRLILERRLLKKEKAWRVVTTVECRTETLGGLSYNDFHVAMLVDVEAGRDGVRDWLLGESESCVNNV